MRIWMVSLLAIVTAGALSCSDPPPDPLPPQPSPTFTSTSPILAPPSPTPPPLPRATPTARPLVLYVGNTGGEGVYIRRTPEKADTIKAWADGTEMIEAGAPKDVGETVWKQVQDPDGTVGWVPAQYLIASKTPADGSPSPAQSPAAVLTPQAGEALLVVGTGSCLRIRAEPGFDGEILDCAEDGVTLREAGESRSVDGDTWLRVVTPFGVEGWVSSTYLER